MARDFENLSDPDDLNDRELRDLVRARLEEHNALDIDDITVRAANGEVILEGRVGTDAERQIAEHVITDVIGITSVRNNLVVDALRRAESPMAIDEHLAEEDRTGGLLLGDRPVPLSPEAEHLADDVDADLSGTSDIGKSIAEGTAWIPPEAPTQEGIDSGGRIGEDR